MKGTGKDCSLQSFDWGGQQCPGASTPRGNDAFPSVSDSPIYPISPFPKKFRFSSAKISDGLFLVNHHKFRISPYFPVSIHFPYFGKFFFPLGLLLQISPLTS